MDAAVDRVRAQAYIIPTDLPEADGTASWTSTTIVVVQVQAAGRHGVGYTYSDASVASLINEKLAPLVIGRDVMDPPAAWRTMNVAVRNLGREGLCATAISALDTALWDLKAVVLDQPLASLLGRYRKSVMIYGSGGFTSYNDQQLTRQLAGWVEKAGCRWVKMKIGTDPDRDPMRVATAKQTIGTVGLFVDANGAYSPKQAQDLGKRFVAEQDVRWFEEPVSADDLRGLRGLRDHIPAPMEIAAGEYGYTTDYFRHMLEAGAVDVLQADATRCGGVTGFMLAAGLCEAFHIDLSAHCAPALHRHLGCAAPRFRHVEWFHDHVSIEQTFFDGAPIPREGTIEPESSRPGLGLSFRQHDAERYAVPGQS